MDRMHPNTNIVIITIKIRIIFYGLQGRNNGTELIVTCYKEFHF